MILYLDSSAIVKQYVVEEGTPDLRNAVARAEIAGTSVVSRAEVVAALRKSVRVGALRERQATILKRRFDRGWPALVRTRVTERLIRHAGALAWTHGLRGYDSVHLASAAAWQQALGSAVTLATFDRPLWTAAKAIALDTFPSDLPSLIDTWKRRPGTRS